MTNKNPKDPAWKTPFRWAAQNGFLKNCRLIILYSEDKNPGNLMGMTPLHVAASKEHLSICQLIIEHIGEDRDKMKLHFIMARDTHQSANYSSITLTIRNLQIVMEIHTTF